jgi:hypothetical protein
MSLLARDDGIEHLDEIAKLLELHGIACKLEEDLMKKCLIAGAVAAFAATSAFAQTTTVSSEYYVVRDATTKKCTMFKTKTEAETGHEGLHRELTALELPRPHRVGEAPAKAGRKIQC